MVVALPSACFLLLFVLSVYIELFIALWCACLLPLYTYWLWSCWLSLIFFFFFFLVFGAASARIAR